MRDCIGMRCREWKFVPSSQAELEENDGVCSGGWINRPKRSSWKFQKGESMYVRGPVRTRTESLTPGPTCQIQVE
jgi:hypothetical protein